MWWLPGWNIIFFMTEEGWSHRRRGVQKHLWEKQTTDCAVSCPRFPPSASATSLSFVKIFNQHLRNWFFMISLSVVKIFNKTLGNWFFTTSLFKMFNQNMGTWFMNLLSLLKIFNQNLGIWSSMISLSFSYLLGYTYWSTVINRNLLANIQRFFL